MTNKEMIEHLKNIKSNLLSDIYIDLSLDEEDIDINQDNQYKAISKAIELLK
tara:strand:+ start:333 stop:488 length:156 start_codon:yes stop_codon:yes gene_type:complete